MIAWIDWLVWGFAGTTLLTTLLAVSQGAGLTRMSIPYLLGTMVTPDRDRSRLLGIVVHLINGWIFSLMYVVAFHAWGGATWWKGLALGALHGGFVVAVLLPVLPALHPRMASETAGPSGVRQLEPPGFLGLHYGLGTPVTALFGHLVFGLVLGAFYDAPP
jgi:uncharacterized membrane protein YagU involved in acid resistance